MKIGIITAMPEETGAIARIVQQIRKIRSGRLVVRQARISGHEIYLMEAGMGFANATTAAGQMIEELRPELILSAGFCGAIREGLRVGDVVLASGLAIVSQAGLQEVAVSIAPVSREFVSRQSLEGCRVCSGLFTSTRTIMAKSRLAALMPPDAPFPVVEMESAAIALLAAENNIPFVGLRTVSDAFDEELGFSLDEFCDERMRIRIPKVLLTIARKPYIIPQLIRLARNSRIAAASLSQAVQRLLADV